MNPDQCAWKRCKQEAVLTWLDRPLCQKHWETVCELTDTQPPADVKREYTKPRKPRRK